MTRVVLVEDDEHTRCALTAALVARGHEVLAAASGLDGLRTVVDEQPDAVVVDLGLRDIDGVELIKMVRAVSAVPIIATAACDDDQHIVGTLDAGADGYVVKPYSAEHLEERLQAVLRRSRPTSHALVEVGPLVIDMGARTAVLDGTALELNRKEFDLLSYLACESGRVVSKRELLTAVWHQPHGGADTTIDVHLSWLRRKLGETAAAPKFIHVVRGVGVKLVDPTAS